MGAERNDKIGGKSLSGTKQLPIAIDIQTGVLRAKVLIAGPCEINLTLRVTPLVTPTDYLLTFGKMFLSSGGKRLAVDRAEDDQRIEDAGLPDDNHCRAVQCESVVLTPALPCEGHDRPRLHLIAGKSELGLWVVTFWTQVKWDANRYPEKTQQRHKVSTGEGNRQGSGQPLKQLARMASATGECPHSG